MWGLDADGKRVLNAAGQIARCEPVDPCGVIYSGTFGYEITALLDWAYDASTHPYHQLYGQRTAPLFFPVCYTPNHPMSSGGLSTTRDAFPGCASSPAPPIQIVGNFTSTNTFRFYRNQQDCSPVTTPTQLIEVRNVGTGTIYVNGQAVAPGCSWVAAEIEDAGYRSGEIVSYTGTGTLVTVSDVP